MASTGPDSWLPRLEEWNSYYLLQTWELVYKYSAKNQHWLWHLSVVSITCIHMISSHGGGEGVYYTNIQARRNEFSIGAASQSW